MEQNFQGLQNEALFSLSHECRCDNKLFLAWLSRKGNGTPLQYFCLENPMDRGAWWAAVHGVARVGHNWVTSLSLFTFMHWRRKWQATPVFLPGESQGQGSLVGCHLWGRTESDTTEVTQQQQQQRVWWGRRREGGSRGRGHMYTYAWFMLRFDIKQQNSSKQLSFN